MNKVEVIATVGTETDAGAEVAQLYADEHDVRGSGAPDGRFGRIRR